MMEHLRFGAEVGLRVISWLTIMAGSVFFGSMLIMATQYVVDWWQVWKGRRRWR